MQPYLIGFCVLVHAGNHYEVLVRNFSLWDEVISKLGINNNA